ncbi:small multi-drug export protein [Arthrobacter sp. MYb213]|uniref:small multi-drug export protein n=1 Tax=Arthrobacter sp. MYb213 TaxID=1848595 RepID=UPI000CFC05C7|nr:small multi-drug export protein [Arthrobacter sp. MYb213]PRB69276.1 small multidrug efflux protein [Arthrobacter sp. MYb213]
MNLIESFQNLISQVPEIAQPLIVALAGAVPFVEGEGAATVGILGGINPLVAAIAAIIGNFVCVAMLVLLGSGAHSALSNRKRAKNLVGAHGADHTDAQQLSENLESGLTEGSERKSNRRIKFQRAFERYGVPGVSLLGPLLLPTHFTATMLAAIGINKTRILIWQAIAIISWTTAMSIFIASVVRVTA